MRMRLEKRRVVYGSIIGAGTFLVGVLLVWLTAPVSEVSDLPEWRAALLVFLDANAVALDSGASSTVTQNLPSLGIGWVLPVLLVSLGTVLTVNAVSGTSRLRYMVENGSPFLYGYLGIGLIGLLESGARPGIALFTGLVLFLGVAIFVGSTVTGKLTRGLPFLGIASLGLVIVLGMIFVLVGLAILDAMLPMVFVTVLGVGAGVGLSWTARNAPR